MLGRIAHHLRSNVVAYIALFIALGGTSYATASKLLPRNSVGTKQLKNNAVIGKKVRNDSLSGADLRESSLGKVPSAAQADHAATADTAANAAHATNADTATNATHAINADVAALATKAQGTFTALFSNRPGPLPLSATFASSGRPLLISVSGSGFVNSTGSFGATVQIDGIPRGEARGFSNEASSHKAFPTASFVVTNLSAGSHTLALRPTIDVAADTKTDASDYFSVSIVELPLSFALGPDGAEPDNSYAAHQNFCAVSAIGSYDPIWLFGTIWPAGDEDWIFQSCSLILLGAQEKIDVFGGAEMDVYSDPAAPAVAANVTTFQGTADFYTMRVHSADAAAYTLRVMYTP